MAPDGFLPEEVTIGGRRFTLRIDGNTCLYQEVPCTSTLTWPSFNGPRTTAYEKTPYYSNISCTGFDYPEDAETIKRKRLQWLRFIRGPDWLKPGRWPELPRRTLRPSPRVTILQPWRWPSPAKPKLPLEVRRIRTELRRLRQPRVPRTCIACLGCYNGRVTATSATRR